MKKQYSYHTGYSMLLLLLCSFSFVNAQKTDTLTYKYLTIKDSASAFQKEDSPLAQIEAQVPVFNENTTVGKWLNQQVKKSLGIDTIAKIEKGIAHSQKQYLADYKKMMKDYKNEVSVSFDYSNYTTMEVSYNHKGFVVLATMWHDYSGGVHGNYATSYTCYDLQHLRELFLTDLVTIDSVQLQQLVEAQFREDNEMESQDALNTILFENYLLPNSNFFFNDDGIGFSYAPYEVAAYAYGQIEVLVPYKNWEPYLKADFKERIQGQ